MAGEGGLMTASAGLEKKRSRRPKLELVENGTSVVDQYSELVTNLVSLSPTPVDPTMIAPAALILQEEGLVAMPKVTFGCNYELDVRSIELDRGYVRAMDSGWLRLHHGRVSVSERFSRAHAIRRTPQADARALELFSLERDDLTQIARHHLLRDAVSRTRDHTT
jgi:hypothetical protein